MESPLKDTVVLGTVTTAGPTTERTAAPWGWMPGDGVGQFSEMWLTIELTKETCPLWEHHQASCDPPCCVLSGQSGSWRTEKGKARDCQESDCPHPNEDSGFPRHSERKSLDEEGMGGNHHAIVMEQAREVGQYPLLSFFSRGSFWSPTASLEWIYAISGGCVLCANECDFHCQDCIGTWTGG